MSTLPVQIPMNNFFLCNFFLQWNITHNKCKIYYLLYLYFISASFCLKIYLQNNYMIEIRYIIVFQQQINAIHDTNKSKHVLFIDRNRIYKIVCFRTIFITKTSETIIRAIFCALYKKTFLLYLCCVQHRSTTVIAIQKYIYLFISIQLFYCGFSRQRKI